MNDVFVKGVQHSTLYALLEEAAQTGKISEARKEYLLIQCTHLAQELVLLKNHRQSTSVSSRDYKRILDTISYIFLQGFEQEELGALCTLDIDVVFERGILILQEKEQDIKNLFYELRRKRLPFANERYNSILDEQLPAYLKQLTAYEGILYYSHTLEDLDYPLVDGIPLFHDMYHLDGIDLVQYYLKRFSLEHSFCEYFRKELPEFIRRYERQKGVEVAYLSLNLCELLWYPWFASLVLFQHATLLFSRQDIERLRAILQHCSLKEAVHQANLAVETAIGKEIAQYLMLFEEQLLSQLQVFVYDDYALFIYDEEENDSYTIDLTQGREEDDFLKLLDEVQQRLDLKDKIQYLNTQKLSAYDLLDLLENDIFMEGEYAVYFAQLSIEELAVVLKLLHPQGGNFHEEWKLDERYLAEIEQEQAWQIHFVAYIKSLPKEKKKKLRTLLGKLSIRS